MPSPRRTCRATRPFRLAGTAWLLTCLFYLPVRAGEMDQDFASWLPPGTLAVHQAADPRVANALFESTFFRQLGQTAALQPFLSDLARSRQDIANRIAAEAGLDQALAAAFLNAPVSMAIVDLVRGPEGGLEPLIVIRVQLPQAVDPSLVFGAIARQINTPANLAAAAELMGRPVPVLTLREEWNTAGGPVPVLRVLGTTWHVAARGPYILVYRGPADGPFKAVLDRSFMAAQPGRQDSLRAQGGYQAAAIGAKAAPGGSFTYINAQRIQPLLAVITGSPVAAIWSALGMDHVQDLGWVGAWNGAGLRHTLYLHTPGPRSGLLSALAPRPVADATVSRLPAAGGGAIALHANLDALMEEGPLLADAIQRAMGGEWAAGGSRGGEWKILGAPARALAASLGGSLVYLPSSDGAVLRFDDADLASFEALVALMEKEGNNRFHERLAANQFTVRYLHRSPGGQMPIAAYCLRRARPEDRRGTLLLSTHPQAIVSLLEPSQPVTRLGEFPDFLRVAEGVDSGFDMFAYVDSRSSFVRLYNYLLPVMNLWTDPSQVSWLPGAGEASRGGSQRMGVAALYAWSNSPLLGADPGLLPPGSLLEPGLFGFGMGVKTDPTGITFTAYSPLGLWGGLVWLADKLVLSNPAAAGLLAAKWWGD